MKLHVKRPSYYRGNMGQCPDMFAIRVLYRGKLSRNSMSSTAFIIGEIPVNVQVCSHYTCYIKERRQSKTVFIVHKGE